MVRRFKLRPASRLRRNADFVAIRSQDKPYRCPYFALFTRVRAPDGADVLSPRIGISAARRVGSAVARNRIKRRLREIFRLHQNELLPEIDIVVSLRPPAARASYRELEQRFLHALKYKKLLTPQTPDASNPEAGED